jgi:3-hydroxybutyrate dehydrogenase
MKISRGRKVLITGAASGIGLECARAFARRGADLVISDLNEAALASVQVEITAMGVHCFGAGVTSQARGLGQLWRRRMLPSDR